MGIDHTHMHTPSHRHCAFHSLWLVNYHLSPWSCNYDPGAVRAHPPPSLPLSLPCCLFSLLCPSLCFHLSVSLVIVLYLECDLIFFVTDYTFALESLSIFSQTYTVYMRCHHLSTVSLLFSLSLILMCMSWFNFCFCSITLWVHKQDFSTWGEFFFPAASLGFENWNMNLALKSLVSLVCVCVSISPALLLTSFSISFIFLSSLCGGFPNHECRISWVTLWTAPAVLPCYSSFFSLWFS